MAPHRGGVAQVGRQTRRAAIVYRRFLQTESMVCIPASFATYTMCDMLNYQGRNIYNTVLQQRSI